MREITSQTTAEYLRLSGHVAESEPIEVRELAGGVSNVVLLVTLPARGERFVLKQARGRLRVKDEWLCPVERIWREVEVLQICGKLVQVRSAECGVRNEGQVEILVPQLLWEDRGNYCYAMTAAPEDHRTWREVLFAGEMAIRSDLAVACGRLLGELHAGSWANGEIAAILDDRTYFEQLRLDPYYRQIARVHVNLAPSVERLIDSVWQNRRSLVHGDFSPKNLLVWPGHMMLIDFEVGHYGDPAFDLGFFLTHLVLKSIWAGERRSEYRKIADDFWRTYQATMWRTVASDEIASLEQRMLWILAGCMLARVDGKSPVEYLSVDQQSVVRELARRWMEGPPQSFEEAMVSVLSTKY